MIRPTFACREHVVDDLLGNVAYRAHSYDNALCVGCAVVVEELIVGAELVVYHPHILLNNSGKRIVVTVAGLAVLEEDISVFCGAAESRGDSG